MSLILIFVVRGHVQLVDGVLVDGLHLREHCFQQRQVLIARTRYVTRKDVKDIGQRWWSRSNVGRERQPPDRTRKDRRKHSVLDVIKDGKSSV